MIIVNKKHSDHFIPHVAKAIRVLKAIFKSQIDTNELYDVFALDFGGNVRSLSDYRKRLKKRMQKMLAERQSVESKANKTRLRTVQFEIQNMTNELHNSTKRLARCINEDPIFIRNAEKIDKSLRYTLNELSGLVYELETHGTLQSFQSFLFALQETPMDHQKIKEQELDSIKKLNKRKEELRLDQSIFTRRESEVKAHIYNTSKIIVDVQKGSNLSFDKQEESSRFQTSITSCNKKEVTLKYHIEKLEEKLLKEEKFHDFLTKFLHQKNLKLELQRIDFDKKHKIRFLSKLNDFELITRKRTKNVKKLMCLQSRLKIHVMEEEAIKLKKAQGVKELKKDSEDTERQNMAATIIQKRCRYCIKFKKTRKKSSKTKKTKKVKKKQN